jgi:hypothetical protein
MRYHMLFTQCSATTLADGASSFLLTAPINKAKITIHGRALLISVVICLVADEQMPWIRKEDFSLSRTTESKSKKERNGAIPLSMAQLTGRLAPVPQRICVSDTKKTPTIHLIHHSMETRLIVEAISRCRHTRASSQNCCFLLIESIPYQWSRNQGQQRRNLFARLCFWRMLEQDVMIVGQNGDLSQGYLILSQRGEKGQEKGPLQLQ